VRDAFCPDALGVAGAQIKPLVERASKISRVKAYNPKQARSPLKARLSGSIETIARGRNRSRQQIISPRRMVGQSQSSMPKPRRAARPTGLPKSARRPIKPAV
jgi:hypothetical protein